MGLSVINEDLFICRKNSKRTSYSCNNSCNRADQPLGHSTSGSHERYKSEERLKWEDDNDCNKKFEDWILKNKISTKKRYKVLRRKFHLMLKMKKS